MNRKQKARCRGPNDARSARPSLPQPAEIFGQWGETQIQTVKIARTKASMKLTTRLAKAGVIYCPAFVQEPGVAEGIAVK